MIEVKHEKGITAISEAFIVALDYKKHEWETQKERKKVRHILGIFLIDSPDSIYLHFKTKKEAMDAYHTLKVHI